MWKTLPFELKLEIFEWLLTFGRYPLSWYKDYCLVNREWFREVVTIVTRENGAYKALQAWGRGLLDMDRLNSVYFCHQISLDFKDMREDLIDLIGRALQSGLVLPNLRKVRYTQDDSTRKVGMGPGVLAWVNAPKLEILYIEISPFTKPISELVDVVEELAKNCENPPAVLLVVSGIKVLLVPGSEARQFYSLVKQYKVELPDDDGRAVYIPVRQWEALARFTSLEMISIFTMYVPMVLERGRIPPCASNFLKTLIINPICGIILLDPESFVAMLKKLQNQLEYLELIFSLTCGGMDVVINELTNQQVSFPQIHTLKLHGQYSMFIPGSERTPDSVKMLRQLEMLVTSKLKTLQFSGPMVNTTQEGKAFWEEFQTRMTKFSEVHTLYVHINEDFSLETLCELALVPIGLNMPELKWLSLKHNPRSRRQEEWNFQAGFGESLGERVLFPKLKYLHNLGKCVGFHANTERCFRQFFNHHFPLLSPNDGVNCVHCEQQDD